MFKPEDFEMDSSESDYSDNNDMSDYANSDLTDTELIDSDDCNTTSQRRNIFAFWLIGVCHTMVYNTAMAATTDALHLYVRMVIEVLIDDLSH